MSFSGSISVASSELYLVWIVVVQPLSCVPLFLTPWTAECQFACPSPSSRVHPNSCPLNWWCHPILCRSILLCLQSFPASVSFPVSWLFTSGGQSIGSSASTSVLSKNIQGWFPLGLTGLISLQSKGLSIVLSSTAVQKHQFLSAQSSL